MSTRGDLAVDDPETLEYLRRIQEELQSGGQSQRNATSVQTTIDGTVKGNTVVLDTGGRWTLTIAIENGGGASYAVDARPEGGDWVNNHYDFGTVTKTTQTYMTGERFVRVRVTDPASGAGNVKITMSASG